MLEDTLAARSSQCHIQTRIYCLAISFHLSCFLLLKLCSFSLSFIMSFTEQPQTRTRLVRNSDGQFVKETYPIEVTMSSSTESPKYEIDSHLGPVEVDKETYDDYLLYNRLGAADPDWKRGRAYRPKDPKACIRLATRTIPEGTFCDDHALMYHRDIIIDNTNIFEPASGAICTFGFLGAPKRKRPPTGANPSPSSPTVDKKQKVEDEKEIADGILKALDAAHPAYLSIRYLQYRVFGEVDERLNTSQLVAFDNAFKYLVNEGLIYSTIDEFHYAITEPSKCEVKLHESAISISECFPSSSLRPANEAFGMFTYDTEEEEDEGSSYKNCKFIVDIKGVVKTGEIVDEVRSSPRFNSIVIYKDNQMYTLRIGYFAYGLEIMKDY